MRRRRWFVVAVLTVALLAGAWLARSEDPPGREPSLEDRPSEPASVIESGASLRGVAGGTEPDRDDVATSPARVPAATDESTPAEPVDLDRPIAALRAALPEPADRALQGRVLVHEGPGRFKPAAGAQALLWKSHGPARSAADIPLQDPTLREGVVDARGAFQFDRLDPGAYLLGVQLADGARRMLWHRFVVPEGVAEDTSAFEPVLFVASAGAVHGRVFDAEGNPREGVRVRVSMKGRWTAGRSLMVEAKTGPDGRYEIAGLVPGSGWVSLPGVPRGEGRHSEHLALALGERLRVDFGSALGLVPFTGRFEYADGQPVRAARRARFLEQRADGRETVYASVPVDANGRFEAVVPPGSHVLRIEVHGSSVAQDWSGVGVERGGGAEQVFELRAPRILGAVESFSPALTSVRVWPKGARWQDHKGHRVVREGRYEVIGYVPGTYLTRAESKYNISAEAIEVTIREDDTVVVVDLPAPRN